MADKINPTLARALIQPYGSGNNYQFLPDETDVEPISGGGVPFESDFAGKNYVGSRQTGNPERWTGNISTRRTTVSKLRNLMKNASCLHNIVVLAGCESQDFTKFSMGEKYIDAGLTGLTPSAPAVQKTTQEDPRAMDALGISAGARVEFHQLAHKLGATSPLVDGSGKHIINLANVRCAGRCGDASAGDLEFIAVGGGDAPATIPRIAYTADGGVTWTTQTIAAVANGVAEWVTVFGNNVIVAVSGTNGGVYRAPLDGVKAGTATFTAVTGIATGTAYNAVEAIGSLVVAVGVTGLLWISRDGGYSFTALASGVATTLSTIAGDDDSMIFIGGASGVVRKITNGRTVSAVTVTGLSTDGVTTLAVPENRSNVLMVGTITGKIFATANAADATPVWVERSFDKPSGGGIIEHMIFSDPMGSFFWVVQSNASTQSRVLMDYSGGAMGSWAVAVGLFTDPVNALINTIAPANADYALTLGEVSAGFAFYGVVFGGE